MKRELLARLLIAAGAIGVVAVPLSLSWRVPLVHAQMAETGGWSPDTLRAEAGEPLHVRLTSDDVVHGFAVGGLDTPAVDVLPGQVTEVTLLFERPGTYTFYCTRWCGLSHWRMRGTIEVSGDGTRETTTSAPLYASLGLDLDAPRAAPRLPERKPIAESPAVDLGGPLAPFRTAAYYRAHSPYAAWLELRENPAFANQSEQWLWDTTASLWRQNTTPEALSRGAQLYAQNCAACHGEGGRGDGVFADDLSAAGEASASGSGQETASMFQRPANLADPARMLTASPALLQGKILRGGMGTGMPSWGPIFTEAQTWDLVAFLYSLQFEYR